MKASERIKISNLRFPYSPEFRSDLTLRAGEALGFTGQPGLGRSAFLRALAGLNQDLPLYSEFFLDSIIISPKTSFQERRKNGIFFLPRKASVSNNLLVWENLFIAESPDLARLWVRQKDLKVKASQILEMLGLDRSVDESASALSPSEKQLLAWARIFIRPRKLILIDESMTNLDHTTQARLEFLLQEQKEKGVCVLCAFPSLHGRLEVFDRIWIVNESGAQELNSDAESRSLSRKMKLLDRESLETKFPPKRKNLSRERVVFKVSDFKLTQNEQIILGPLDLQVYSSEICGIFGPSEGGRLDFMFSLVGARDGLQVSGNCYLDGIRSSGIDLSEDQVGLISGFQSRFGIFESQNLAFNLTLSSLPKIHRWSWIRAREEYELFDHYKKVLRIKEARATSPAQSQGRLNRIKILLARNLLKKPKLILLDEPLRGLHSNEREELYFYLREVADQGVALLLASSSLPEQTEFCDRVYVMNQGQIKGEWTGDSLTAENLVKAVY